jgi:uncharacterized repeat protein (TIGR01451 family)
VLNKVSVTKPDNPDNPEEPDLPPTEGEEEVPAEQKPSAKVEKTATETSFEAVGDELHYTVVITNTGNITLKNLEITDTLVPFEDMTLTGDANNDGHLDVDETWTLTYTYTVTQDDLDAGKVLNKVSVTKPENPDNPDEPDLPPAEEEHVVPGPAFLDIEAIINPTKSLAGRVLTAGEFTFELRQGGHAAAKRNKRCGRQYPLLASRLHTGRYWPDLQLHHCRSTGNGSEHDLF